MRTILNTVGASLENNAKRQGTDFSDALAVQAFIREDPQAACAELNFLSRFLEQGDEVELLHSDTDSGSRCSRYLEDYLRTLGYTCAVHRVPGLTQKAAGFADYGLRALVHLLAQRVTAARRRAREVAINATGGFKPEVAYATVLGLVFRVPVYYIHESFKDIIEIPPSPIGWDTGLILESADFFEWVDEEPRPTRQVRARAAQLPQPEAVQMLLEDQSDGTTLLSPLGEAYSRAFSDEEEAAQSVPLRFSKRAKQAWEHLDSSQQAAYRKVLRRLRMPNRDSQSERKSGGGEALGYPKGGVDERVFYTFRDGAVYVFELTRHGSDYDRLCRTPLLFADYQPFGEQELF